MRGASTAGTLGARHRLFLEALDSHGELGESQTGKGFNTYLFKPFFILEIDFRKLLFLNPDKR